MGEVEDASGSVSALESLLSVNEFEAAAAGRLDQTTWDYYRSGAWGEQTVGANVEAWSTYWLRPRVMRDVSSVDISTHLLGSSVRAPLLVAPSALHQMAHPDGEVATARGARDAELPMVLSSLSTYPIEDVAQAIAPSPWAMQLYISQDRPFSRELAQRAEAAGAAALMITVDTPLWGVRERDIHNRFRVPDGMRIANLERPGQPTGHSGSGIGSALGWTVDATLTWDDVQFMREAVSIPIWVKGVLRDDDALEALDQGVDGIVVSNHGGRQLDGAVPTAYALPEIVDAVAGRVPVIVDGGVRRGADILRALALGADAVQVGRPVLWGLAVGGQDGVRRVLDILVSELELAMALAGCPSLGDVTGDLIATD